MTQLRLPKPLTVAQAARRLGCTPWTVYRLIWRGRLPGAFQLEREWRIPAASVDAICSTCSVPHNEVG